MSSNKPVFQQFVEANQALLNCYNAVTEETYKKQGESVCSSQREQVKDILRSNGLVMSNLVRERVDILYKLGAVKAAEAKLKQQN